MIKSQIKNVISNYLKKKNLKTVPFDSREAQIENVRYDWLRKQNIRTIIDVGASTGEFATRIRSYFPDAMILSFEPINNSFNELNKKFKNDPKFKAFNIALSNTTGSAEFYRNEHVGSSSFLELSNLHLEAHPYAIKCEKISVQVDTLDNIFEERDIIPQILLKMDVQGYEMKVMQGGKHFLDKTKAIYTEVSFGELYKDQPLFYDIIHYLNERGFRMVGIENVAQSTKDGSFLNADAIFVKD